MSPAGGGTRRLALTIANNTATTGTISMSDATLAGQAAEPGSDTSGLTQPNGIILAGATSILAAGVSWARAGGGWAVIGNGTQVVRYTGTSGNTITGIPSTGVGAIVASISYNTTITAAPCLVGVPTSGDGSITYAINKGDDVNIVETVDDLVAQAELSLLLDPDDDLGGAAGIVASFHKDERISRTETAARARAYLEYNSSFYRQAHYQSRDANITALRTQVFDIAAPPSVSDTLKIQSVTKTFEDAEPPIFPLCDVDASSRLFTYEDLLRSSRGE